MADERRSWPAITMGTILGIESINSQPDVPAENNTQHNRKTETRGKTLLLQNLILEASHLIWTLRCERAIQMKQHAPEEIRSSEEDGPKQQDNHRQTKIRSSRIV